MALLNQVLDAHTYFEKKTVMGTLKALATLIDWNEIQYFDSCRAKISEFLQEKQLRAGAFQCLSAIVNKGRPEHMERLNVIYQSGIVEQIQSSVLVLLLDYETNADTEEYEEEKAYMRAVSLAVYQMGKWCLAVSNASSAAQSDPFTDPNAR